eukprot:scaffold101_cov123-Cylindrotheca_fusiformis.AAC.18
MSSSLIWTAYQMKESITNVGETPVTDDGEIKGKDSDYLVTGFKTAPFALAVLGLVAIAVIVMISSALFIIDFSSSLIIALGVLAVWQKNRLIRLGGLRGNINKLRSMVNEFTLENDKLKSSNDKLEKENSDLSYVTKDIESLADGMGCGVNRLIESIEEMNDIHQQMNHHLERQVMQQVIDIGLKSDRDQDFTINSKSELKRLEQRLSSMPGIIFNAENFRKVTKYDDPENPGIALHDIMEMFRNLKDPSIPPEDNIFQLVPESHVEQVYKKKRDSGVYSRGNNSGNQTPVDTVKSWFSPNKK